MQGSRDGIGDILQIIMSGYEINDRDVEAVVSWLKIFHPANANEEYARGMLIAMKLSYRQVGRDNPDKLEDFYFEYNNRTNQNGKRSEE